MVWIIVGVIIFLLLIFIIFNYNSLVKVRNVVHDQWAQIEVLLKRRADLIPNLVETVKGYTKHESETLEAVIEARNKAIKANNPNDEMQANGELGSALKKLFALAEDYPDLKANTNFLDLQNNLKETEDKISYARQFYNDSVLKYKNKIEVFPSNMIASLFGFRAISFFEASDEERTNPKIKF